jgi:serine protease
MKHLKITLISTVMCTLLHSSVHAEAYNLVLKHKSNQDLKYTTNAALKQDMKYSLERMALDIKKSTHRVINDSRYTLVTIDAESPEQAIQLLQNTGEYDSVELDVVVRTPKPTSAVAFNVKINADDGLPNDLYYDNQKPYLAPLSMGQNETGEYLAGHNFEGVWRTHNTSEKIIRVGVGDSDFTRHPDIIYSNQGLDLKEKDNDPFQTDAEVEEHFCGSHGNGVSSVIAAIRDNSFGLAGAAVNTEVVAARVMDCGSGGSIFADAIRWFAGDSLGDGIEDISKPVDVINLSLGAKYPGGCTPFIQDSIDYATQRNIPVIVAAGNDNIDIKDFLPAGCDGVIVAAATDWGNNRAGFSNYGNNVTLSAQGTDVIAYSTQRYEGDELVYKYNGTSFSAPLVTSAVATALGQVDELSIDEINFLLTATSDNYNDNSTCLLEDKYCGAGGLNAKAFVEAAKKLKQGELGYIQHALLDTDECVSVIIQNHLIIPSCRLYEVSFNSFAQEKSNITYSLYRVKIGNELMLDNATLEVIIDSTSNPTMLMEFSQAELQDFDYGIRVCVDSNCQSIIPIKVNLDDAPQCES